MSTEKREQLIAEGKVRADGSRVQVCPTCLREFAPGESMPDTGDSAVGVAEPAAAGAGDPAQEG